ncbi:hypothetical protein RRF57_009859 [Xylaria bambusicola]|uniref:Uncharacterized protein n=1 Tax=Xylaria bambusicola TaxID=326684 RepID=A0AAN7ZCB4_9PEZI
MPEITNKDGILRATIITTINQSATRSPVEAEQSVGIGDGRSIQLESLLGPFWGRKLDETITGITITCQLRRIA